MRVRFLCLMNRGPKQGRNYLNTISKPFSTQKLTMKNLSSWLPKILVLSLVANFVFGLFFGIIIFSNQNINLITLKNTDIFLSLT